MRALVMPFAARKERNKCAVRSHIAPMGHQPSSTPGSSGFWPLRDPFPDVRSTVAGVAVDAVGQSHGNMGLWRTVVIA
jgi:hypothetical protein